VRVNFHLKKLRTKKHSARQPSSLIHQSLRPLLPENGVQTCAQPKRQTQAACGMDLHN